MVNSLPLRQRFVLLGASNATVGFPTIVELVRQRTGEPIEIMSATALGRSFGKKSQIFFRGLLGILDCQLWRQLEARPKPPTRALITDIGNDILYGEPVESIVRWVAQAIQRLSDAGARIAVTQLPVANFPALGRRRFALFRQLFFPGCRLGYDAVLGQALELNERVIEIAKQHEIQAIPHRPEWYGLDPIHYRRRCRAAAWGELLRPLFDDPRHLQNFVAPLPRTAYLRALAPAERWILGACCKREQPAGRLSDGTTISLY